MTELSALEILNAGMDDIDDLPEFAVPANGAYNLSTKVELKEVNSHPVIEAKFTVVEVLELEQPDAAPPKVGDQFSMLFTLDNEYGLGNLKKFMGPFFERFGHKTIKDFVEAGSEAVQISATVRQRADKKDPNKIYASVLNVQIA